MSNKRKHIFISHSTGNAGVAKKICDSLEQDGLSCWIAPRDVGHSRNWAEAIIEGIEHCEVFVLIFSRDSNSSDEVSREVLRAARSGKAVYLFRVSDDPLSTDLEYHLSAHQYHEICSRSSPKKAHLLQLADAIRGYLPTKGVKVPKRKERTLLGLGLKAVKICALLFAFLWTAMFLHNFVDLERTRGVAAREALASCGQLPVNVFRGLLSRMPDPLAADDEPVATPDEKDATARSREWHMEARLFDGKQDTKADLQKLIAEVREQDAATKRVEFQKLMIEIVELQQALGRSRWDSWDRLSKEQEELMNGLQQCAESIEKVALTLPTGAALVRELEELRDEVTAKNKQVADLTTKIAALEKGQ